MGMGCDRLIKYHYGFQNTEVAANDHSACTFSCLLQTLCWRTHARHLMLMEYILKYMYTVHNMFRLI